MKILGVDIKGGECFFVLLKGTKNNFEIVDFPKKLGLDDLYDTKALKHFSKSLEELLTISDLQFIAIKKRLEKGKFAGGPMSFKIEGLIQMASPCEICFYGAKQVSQYESDEVDKSLSKYQYQAYFTALKCLNEKG